MTHRAFKCRRCFHDLAASQAMKKSIKAMKAAKARTSDGKPIIASKSGMIAVTKMKMGGWRICEFTAAKLKVPKEDLEMMEKDHAGAPELPMFVATLAMIRISNLQKELAASRATEAKLSAKLAARIEETKQARLAAARDVDDNSRDPGYRLGRHDEWRDWYKWASRCCT